MGEGRMDCVAEPPSFFTVVISRGMDDGGDESEEGEFHSADVGSIEREVTPYVGRMAEGQGQL
jgi:hypothetical protein